MRLTIKGGCTWSEMGRHLTDYRKKQTRTLRITENNFYKRWRHETRHSGPPVKVVPAPLPFHAYSWATGRKTFYPVLRTSASLLCLFLKKH